MLPPFSTLRLVLPKHSGFEFPLTVFLPTYCSTLHPLPCQQSCLGFSGSIWWSSFHFLSMISLGNRVLSPEHLLHSLFKAVQKVLSHYSISLWCIKRNRHRLGGTVILPINCHHKSRIQISIRVKGTANLAGLNTHTWRCYTHLEHSSWCLPKGNGFASFFSEYLIEIARVHFKKLQEWPKLELGKRKTHLVLPILFQGK